MPSMDEYIEKRIGEGTEFTPKQLSYAFEVHVSTIYRHIQEGKLRAHRFMGYKVDRQSIQDWVQQLQRY